MSSYNENSDDNISIATSLVGDSSDDDLAKDFDADETDRLSTDKDNDYEKSPRDNTSLKIHGSKINPDDYYSNSFKQHNLDEVLNETKKPKVTSQKLEDIGRNYKFSPRSFRSPRQSPRNLNEVEFEDDDQDVIFKCKKCGKPKKIKNNNFYIARPDFENMSTEEKFRQSKIYDGTIDKIRKENASMNFPMVSVNSTPEEKFKIINDYLKHIKNSKSVKKYKFGITTLNKFVELFFSFCLGIDFSGYSAEQESLLVHYDSILEQLGEQYQSKSSRVKKSPINALIQTYFISLGIFVGFKLLEKAIDYFSKTSNVGATASFGFKLADNQYNFKKQLYEMCLEDDSVYIDTEDIYDSVDDFLKKNKQDEKNTTLLEGGINMVSTLFNSTKQKDDDTSNAGNTTRRTTTYKD